VHLQGGFFMEDLSRWSDSIVQYERIGWSLDPNVKAPWVAIEDIADIATIAARVNAVATGRSIGLLTGLHTTAFLVSVEDERTSCRPCQAPIHPRN